MPNYICTKDNKINKGYFNEINLNGYNFKPKNRVKYNGIKVSHVTMFNPILTEKIIHKKIKIQMTYYLNILIALIEDDSDDQPATLALDSLKTYKAMLIDKYAKYLSPEYIKELFLQVKFIEDELRQKIKETALYYTPLKSRRR